MVKLSDMTEIEKTIMTRVGAKVVEALKDAPLEVEGTPHMAVWYDSKSSFRQKPVLAGLNFFITAHHIGKRGILIFKLSPEDTQEYQFGEVASNKLDDIFPLAGSLLALAFAPTSGLENFTAVMDSMIIEESNLLQSETIAAEEAKAAAYENNEQFGIF